MRRVACLVIVVSAGCSHRFEDATLDAASNIMVGSTATGSVTYETCDDQGAACQTNGIDIDSASIAPAGVFSVDTQTDVFFYKALRAGTATLTVEDDDGDIFDLMVTAAVPDYIKVDVDCPSAVPEWDQTLGTTRAFGPDAEVSATFVIYAKSVSDYPLYHDASVVPIESPMLAVKDDPTVAGTGQVVFTTRATPGTGAITSPYDTRVAIPLVVFAPGDATGFRLRANASIQVGTATDASALVTIGNGQLTCRDDFARTARTLTPETCMLWHPSLIEPQTMLAVTGRNIFSVRGIAPGTCTIEVALDGTATTHQQSIEVTP